MTNAEIRDAVRLHLDLDAEDLPDSIIDGWIRQGVYKMLDPKRDWPFLQSQWTLSTVAGTAEYDLSTLAADLKKIESIRDPRNLRGRLHWMGVDAGDQRYENVPSAGDTIMAFSTWGSTLILYPTPSTVIDLKIRGVRNVNVAATTPDIPLDGHDVLYEFVLGQAYAQQDDLESFTLHMQLFNEGLAAWTDRYQEPADSGPLVLGGTRDDRVFAAPRFDWE